MAKLSDSYLSLIPATIAGIPCLLGVDYFHRQDADFGACNRDDYFGYVDVEYSVMDRKGYRAKWLERKITKQIDADLIQTILDY